LRSKRKIRALEQESLCAWIYAIESAAYGTANGFITHHNHNTNSGLGIGMFQTNSTSQCFVSVNAGNGSSRIHSSASYRGSTHIKGAWHHICLTYDADGKIRMYVDGKEDMTARDYALKNVEEYFDLFNWSVGHSGNASYRPKCKICDVRIYDHALSKAEIKELTKVKLVHCNFDDDLIEGTTNLITSLKAGGRTVYDAKNLTITTTGENIDTYFHFNTSEALVSGTTYTISCYGENIG
jgi:hypothetical protein